MLSSKVYTDYIKDPFNTETTMTYLRETLPRHKVHGLECNFNRSLPPYGISYENLTYDVPYHEKKSIISTLDTTMHTALCQDWFITCLQSSWMRPFTIILVKTKKWNLSNSSLGMGKLQELTLIVSFTEPYGKYTRIHNVPYINNCDNWNRIIPVTMLLVMLFNACFMYQDSANRNLLITALNRFDYGKSLTDDTFMNTQVSSTHASIFFKQELFVFWWSRRCAVFSYLQRRVCSSNFYC